MEAHQYPIATKGVSMVELTRRPRMALSKRSPNRDTAQSEICDVFTPKAST